MLGGYSMTFYGQITKNYGWELDFFRIVCGFKNGIAFFDGDITLDLYREDYSPRFTIYLCVMNIKLFEFNIYYAFKRITYSKLFVNNH